MKESLNFTCSKCNHKHCTVGQMRATGGIWSKIFDVQTQKFSTVTCDNCKHTEFYKSPTKGLSNLFDLFTN